MGMEVRLIKLMSSERINDAQETIAQILKFNTLILPFYIT